MKVAVVTLDIVKSRNYEPRERRVIQSEMLKSWSSIRRDYDGELKSRLSVTSGDEFQFVTKNLRSAFLILTKLRLHARLIGARPPVTIRAAIGIGERTVNGTENSYTQDGSAFRQARAGIESLERQSRQLTVIKSGAKDSGENMNGFLPALDFIYAGWTAAQAKIILLSLGGKSGDEIARKLKMTPANVSKHVRRAGWQEYETAMRAIFRLTDKG